MENTGYLACFVVYYVLQRNNATAGFSFAGELSWTSPTFSFFFAVFTKAKRHSPLLSLCPGLLRPGHKPLSFPKDVIKC